MTITQSRDVVNPLRNRHPAGGCGRSGKGARKWSWSGGLRSSRSFSSRRSRMPRLRGHRASGAARRSIHRPRRRPPSRPRSNPLRNRRPRRRRRRRRRRTARTARRSLTAAAERARSRRVTARRRVPRQRRRTPRGRPAARARRPARSGAHSAGVKPRLPSCSRPSGGATPLGGEAVQGAEGRAAASTVGDRGRLRRRLDRVRAPVPRARVGREPRTRAAHARPCGARPSDVALGARSTPRMDDAPGAPGVVRPQQARARPPVREHDVAVPSVEHGARGT